MRIQPLLPALFGALFMLTACDGSQDRSGGGAQVAVGGLVAVGAPVAGAVVELRCAGGDFDTTTDAGGLWQVEVPEGATPCAIKASGGTPPATLYSYADGPGTVNVTPLTTLAVARAAATSSGSTDLASWFASVDATDLMLADAVADSRDQLLNQLEAAGYAVPVNLDPFTSHFDASPGDPHDDLLEALAAAMASNGQSFEELVEAFVGEAPLPTPEEEPAGTVPTISITAPAAASVLAQSSTDGEVTLALMISVDHFDLGQGAWRLYIDGQLQSGSYGGSSGSHVATLSPGAHVLSVELLDAQDRPLDPPVLSAGVSITVAAFVSDTVPPVLNLPASITLIAPAGQGGISATDAGIVAFLAAATAHDAEDGDLTTAITHDAPTTFPIGTTTVTFSVTDRAGNPATATRTVTVTAEVVVVAHYTITGSISGATGAVGWETLALGGIYHDGQHGNGPVEFTYGEGLEEGTPYIIIVSYPPSGQTCAVANGDGTLMDDVTNVEILCVDEDPEVEPDPGESGSGFRELANGVAFTRMDKPEGLDVYALGYVRDADGAGRVLFSRPVDISGALTNVRAYHFAHYKADGSLDTSKGDAGITRVCGDCSADHPLWQWNGAENQFAWNLSVAAVLPDGRMIAVLASRAVKGFENSYFPMHDRALVRFTREGELDTSFGEQGVLPLQFEGEPVRFYSFAGSSIPISHQPDANGHLLVFVGHARLLKIDMDGSIVTGFADNGVLTMERSSAPHQFLLDTEGDIFIFRQTTTMSAIGVAAGTQTNVSDTYTIGSYRLAAHPHGGALMIRKDNPTAPTHIRHIGGDGEEIASVQVDVGVLHRDGQFIWLDDNRLLFTALGSDSGDGAVSRAFVVYDVGLNAIDNPYADNCGESDAGCSQRFSSEVVYPLPDGTVRHPHAGGSAWSGFIQEGDGTFYHFYDDFDAWVLTRFPKH